MRCRDCFLVFMAKLSYNSHAFSEAGLGSVQPQPGSLGTTGATGTIETASSILFVSFFTGVMFLPVLLGYITNAG